MSSNLDRIPPLSSELVALERLKKSYNLVSPLAPSFLIGSSYLQVTRTTIISRTSSNFGQIRPRTAEFAALEHSSAFIFDRIFFILAGNQTCIISRTSSNFSQVRPRTAELAALDRLKKKSHRFIMGKSC